MSQDQRNILTCSYLVSFRTCVDVLLILPYFWLFIISFIYILLSYKIVPSHSKPLKSLSPMPIPLKLHLLALLLAIFYITFISSFSHNHGIIIPLYPVFYKYFWKRFYYLYGPHSHYMILA